MIIITIIIIIIIIIISNSYSAFLPYEYVQASIEMTVERLRWSTTAAHKYFIY